MSNQLADIQKRLGKLVRVPITWNKSSLSENESRVLSKLIEASKPMDEIFLRQIYEKNPEIRDRLMKSTKPEDKELLKFFLWNMGPWDMLENKKPFIGNLEKPAGAEFYPHDMSKEEFETWIKDHPADKEAFLNPRTVIERKAGKLVATPYSIKYRKFLEPAAKLLKEAAELTDNLSLRKFLESRAEAFLSNDYFQSDVNWINLDSKIEIIIGPYEQYEDALLGCKAGFESFVTIKDLEESEKLKKYIQHLKAIDESLPINPKFKFTGFEKQMPKISVASQVFASGEGNSGYRTMAYSLPNDKKIIEQEGSKKVLLKNIMGTKFNKIIHPIAEKFIEEKQLAYVTFNAFFIHVLTHEFSHTLGPAHVLTDGKKIPVEEKLKELYLPLEEAKAEICGLYCAIYFIDKGILPKKMEKEFYATYLPETFRHIRFGLKDAHGKGLMSAFNYLKEKNAFSYDEQTTKFSVNYDKFHEVLLQLLTDLLNIQAEGNYEKAKNFLDTYGFIPQEIEKNSTKLKEVPVDIYPKYKI